MACRGVFFALTSVEKEHLLQLDKDEKLVRYIQEQIEGAWDEPLRLGRNAHGESEGFSNQLFIFDSYSNYSKYFYAAASASWFTGGTD
jgi:hypothetical protein